MRRCCRVRVVAEGRRRRSGCIESLVVGSNGLRQAKALRSRLETPSVVAMDCTERGRFVG